MVGIGSCWGLLLLSFVPPGHATRGTRLGRAQEAAGRKLHHDAQRGAIHPPLDPKSDKHFFRTDYPDDFRPKPAPDHIRKFDHPYPVVQDHETYDKDFVKDENSDNGEWRSQMVYDDLRTKLKRKRHELKKAYEREQEERRKRDHVLNEEKVMHEAAKKAAEEAEGAQKNATEAKDRLKALQSKGVGDGDEDGGNGKINEAVSEVKEKMKTLEDCQKQLNEAQAKLKKVMAEKLEYEKETAAARVATQAALNKNLTQAEAEYEEAAGNSSNVSAAAKSLEAKDAALKKELAEAETVHQATLEEYNKEAKDTEKTEIQAQKAAEQLRKYRDEVDQNGGVTRAVKRSGSRPAANAPSFAIGLLLLWLACASAA